jgi:lysophospholipase L1-like esterase
MTVRGAAARGGLALASVVLVVALAELSLRLLDVGPRIAAVARGSLRLSDDPELAYELRPGWAGEINAHGMRDRERTIERAPGRGRIAAIGDSVTYGLMLAPADAWPAQLEALLARDGGGSGAEVLNFGVPGYSAQQIAAQLEHRVVAFSPDLVVYGYVLNDPQARSFEREHLERDEREIDLARSPLERLLVRSRLFLLARRAALGGEAGAETIPGRTSDHRDIVDPAFAAFRRNALEGYFHRLHSGRSAARVDAAFERIARVSAEHGFPVLVAIFPVLTEGFADAYPLGDVHARVAAAATRAGLRALDLAPAFQAAARRLGRPLERDFLHPNELGQRVAALALRARLAEWARAREADVPRRDLPASPGTSETSRGRALRPEVDAEIDAILGARPHP